MTTLQSGLDSAVSATVDSVTKALIIQPAGTKSFNVSVRPENSLSDAGGRLKTASQFVQWEYNFASGIKLDYFDAAVLGAGTFAPATVAVNGAAAAPNNDGAVNLNTTTASATGAWVQGLAHIKATPGSSLQAEAQFNINILQANQNVKIGFFTDQGTFPSNAGDGFYFDVVGGAFFVTRRTLTGGGVGAVFATAQASWNLDKLDGTGDSAFTFDAAKAILINTFVMQVLQNGSVRVGFRFDTIGLVFVHEFLADELATPLTRTTCFPFRASIDNTGVTGTPGILRLYNASISTETSPASRQWRYRAGNSGTAAKAILATAPVGALYPLIAIRSAITNDYTKRAHVIPTKGSIFVQTAVTGPLALIWSLVYAPSTLTGATFAAVTGENVQTDQAATSTTAIAGGTVLASGIIPNAVGNFPIDLSHLDDSLVRISQNALGNLTTVGANVIVLCVGALGAAATVGGGFFATIDWKDTA